VIVSFLALFSIEINRNKFLSGLSWLGLLNKLFKKFSEIG